MDRATLIERYLGIPFKHAADGPDGLDCWTFVRAVYRDLGVTLYGVSEYPVDWEQKGYNHIAEQYPHQWEETLDPLYLDLCLFRNAREVLCHCGLYLSPTEFIHCDRRAGVIVSHLSRYDHKLAGYFRLKGNRR